MQAEVEAKALEEEFLRWKQQHEMEAQEHGGTKQFFFFLQKIDCKIFIFLSQAKNSIKKNAPINFADETPAKPKFKLGDRVLIQGLEKATSCNNQLGFVKFGPYGGRHGVELDSGSSILVKPCNMVLQQSSGVDDVPNTPTPQQSPPDSATVSNSAVPLATPSTPINSSRSASTIVPPSPRSQSGTFVADTNGAVDADEKRRGHLAERHNSLSSVSSVPASFSPSVSSSPSPIRAPVPAQTQAPSFSPQLFPGSASSQILPAEQVAAIMDSPHTMFTMHNAKTPLQTFVFGLNKRKENGGAVDPIEPVIALVLEKQEGGSSTAVYRVPRSQLGYAYSIVSCGPHKNKGLYELRIASFDSVSLEISTTKQGKALATAIIRNRRLKVNSVQVSTNSPTMNVNDVDSVELKGLMTEDDGEVEQVVMLPRMSKLKG
jgi:hypothetical protein